MDLRKKDEEPEQLRKDEETLKAQPSAQEWWDSIRYSEESRDSER